MIQDHSYFRPRVGWFFAKRIVEFGLACLLFFIMATTGGERIKIFMFGTGLVGILLLLFILWMSVIFLRNIVLSKRDIELRANSAYNSLRLLAVLSTWLYMVKYISFF